MRASVCTAPPDVASSSVQLSSCQRGDTHTHTCVCVFVCMYACMYVLMYVCMYVCACAGVFGCVCVWRPRKTLLATHRLDVRVRLARIPADGAPDIRLQTHSRASARPSFASRCCARAGSACTAGSGPCNARDARAMAALAGGACAMRRLRRGWLRARAVFSALMLPRTVQYAGASTLQSIPVYPLIELPPCHGPSAADHTGADLLRPAAAAPFKAHSTPTSTSALCAGRRADYFQIGGRAQCAGRRARRRARASAAAPRHDGPQRARVPSAAPAGMLGVASHRTAVAML